MSLSYEIIQYIFAIGASDITDLIGNTLGGICGIFVYMIIRCLFKNDKKINKILNILASIGTVIVVFALMILVVVNV